MIKLSSIGSFFEEHVEKIVLVIVGIICAFLLVTRVILSPNTVSYDGRNFSPSAIDNYVYEQAQGLRQKLNEPPEQMDSYEPKVDEFLAKLESTINNVDTSLWTMVPSELGAEVIAGSVEGGIYSLPPIGDVNEVAVEHIRAVAYLPIDRVTPENPYDKAGNEPNDLDFVTVEAKFDVDQLYDRFNESFFEDVEEQWADPCLAKPIFAAVNLQRQELGSDGTWSNWLNIPRAKIDQYQRMFQNIEDITDLPPGGLKVQMLQFENKQTQIDLLQPEAYQIASADEEWFPPVLHRRWIDLQRKEKQEERRQAREDEKEQRGQQEGRTRRTDSRTGGAGGRTTRGGGLGGGLDGGYGGGSNTRSRSRSRDSQSSPGGYMNEGGAGTGSRRRTSRTRGGAGTDPMMDMGMYGNEMYGGGRGGNIRRQPTSNDVYYDFDEVSLNRLTDFSKLKEPVLFWAHDDTLEPKKTYRYRIRLGVFNPVAGTNRLSQQDMDKKDKVILWSGFSDVTEPVEIPGRSYFFARDIQDAAKTITVTVCQYVLGHWYSEDFKVSKGEVIGDVMENEIEEDRTQRSRSLGGRITGGRGTGGRTTADYMGDYMGDRFASRAMMPQQRSNVPETIDYGTGAVMVDAMSINDWWGETARRSRHYYEMLYSYDGINIEHMPIGTTYWPKEMQLEFNRISMLEREPHEPFKDFGSSRRSSRPGGMGEYDDLGGYDEMYDMEMYDMGMGGMR